MLAYKQITPTQNQRLNEVFFFLVYFFYCLCFVWFEDIQTQKNSQTIQTENLTATQIKIFAYPRLTLILHPGLGARCQRFQKHGIMFKDRKHD